MSLTHATALRSTLADAVDAAINTGSGAAKLRLRDGATTIVDFELQNPAFGNAAAGVITLEGVPIAAEAGAAGELDNFQILDRDGGVVLSGSVSGSGMGGDIEVSNINVADEQECSLDSLTYTAPA